MIYAKCIRGTQIAKDKNEFEEMKMYSKNTVYCEGEETVLDEYLLDCVPLNCIFQCLKYGDYIAIIESEDLDYEKDYREGATVVSDKITSKKQKVVKILDPRKIEVIDFILNEVGDIKKILPGHASEDNLGIDTYNYLLKKLGWNDDFISTESR
nr:MAG TPA: hypothetical protein [Caudoviricetes sp.]